MINRTLSVFTLVLGFLVAPLAGAATLTQWGTLTSVVRADCGGVCDDTNLINGLFASTDFASDGGVNQLAATISIGDAARGAEAHAEVVGGLALPHLQVAAHADTNGFAGGVAAAVQGYEYQGAGATITIDVSLSGSVLNDNGGLHTGLGALVFLFTSDALTDFLSTPASALGSFALGSEFLALTSVDSLPSDPLADPNPFEETTTNPAVNLSGSVSIELGDGTLTPQQFYLGAYLYGFADGNGQAVESLNSLNFDFAAGVDTAALAAASVPLPAAAWLLAPGLALLGRRRRATA